LHCHKILKRYLFKRGELKKASLFSFYKNMASDFIGYKGTVYEKYRNIDFFSIPLV